MQCKYVQRKLLTKKLNIMRILERLEQLKKKNSTNINNLVQFVKPNWFMQIKTP